MSAIDHYKSKNKEKENRVGTVWVRHLKVEEEEEVVNVKGTTFTPREKPSNGFGTFDVHPIQKYIVTYVYTLQDRIISVVLKILRYFEPF